MLAFLSLCLSTTRIDAQDQAPSLQFVPSDAVAVAVLYPKRMLERSTSPVLPLQLISMVLRNGRRH
jgi:hypothetical protein